MPRLRVRHMAWKRFSVEKPSLNKTYSPKTRRKIRICRYQVKKHIFYVSSLALSMRQPLSFKVVKNKPQIEKDPVCRGIRKDPKMKKKTISVTVTYLLISKTASSESRSELSYGELTRVHGSSVPALHEEPFQYQAPLWGNRAIYKASAK